MEIVFQKPDKTNVQDYGILSPQGISYVLRPELFDVTGIIIGYIRLRNLDGTIAATLYFRYLLVSDLVDTESLRRSYMATLTDIVNEAQTILDGLQSGSFATPAYVDNKFNVLDLAKVNRIGDTMTGDLNIQNPSSNSRIILKTSNILSHIYNTSNQFNITTFGSDTSYVRELVIWAPSYLADDKKGLQYIAETAGIYNTYDIWHGLNLPFTTGTWVPGAGNAGYTLTFTAASYIRLGSYVYVSTNVTITKAAGTASDGLTVVIDGLPIACKNITGTYQTISVGYTNSATIRNAIIAPASARINLTADTGYFTVGTLPTSGTVSVFLSGIYPID